jgi:hypothetical protein
MLHAAVQAYRGEARKVTVSNGQREVGESLRRLDIPHELEYITGDSEADSHEGLCTILSIVQDDPSHT